MTRGKRKGETMTTRERTQLINKLQRRHPGTRRQRNYHGAGKYSVDFFCQRTGARVASYGTTN